MMTGKVVILFIGHKLLSSLYQHFNFCYKLNIHFVTSNRTNVKLVNVWQSLAYSPLGAIVSPPSEYLRKTLTY